MHNLTYGSYHPLSREEFYIIYLHKLNEIERKTTKILLKGIITPKALERFKKITQELEILKQRQRVESHLSTLSFKTNHYGNASILSSETAEVEPLKTLMNKIFESMSSIESPKLHDQRLQFNGDTFLPKIVEPKYFAMHEDVSCFVTAWKQIPTAGENKKRKAHVLSSQDSSDLAPIHPYNTKQTPLLPNIKHLFEEAARTHGQAFVDKSPPTNDRPKYFSVIEDIPSARIDQKEKTKKNHSLFF